jgi:hypothetical protein
MTTTMMSARRQTKALGKRIGAAAFLFYLVKGLIWLALGAAGYAGWAH